MPSLAKSFTSRYGALQREDHRAAGDRGVPSITELYLAWRDDADGGDDSEQRLYEAVRAELQRVAKAQMRGQPVGHTLQTTALVHEAWLRLRKNLGDEINDSGYLIALAARAMRSILVDHARVKKRDKRRPPGERLPLDGVVAAYEDRVPDLVALDEALAKLAAMDADMARLVELKFFGGLTMDAVADALGISPRKAARDWSTARAWLHRQLS